jgi:hypothetical protein
VQIPPVASELLARGLDEITRGTRHDVAGYRALNVDAHGRSLRPSLFDDSKNVGKNAGDYFGCRLCAGSAVWKYKAIYRLNDEQVGQWSDVASISVMG